MRNEGLRSRRAIFLVVLSSSSLSSFCYDMGGYMVHYDVWVCLLHAKYLLSLATIQLKMLKPHTLDSPEYPQPSRI